MVYCVLNTSLVLLTTTEIRIAGKNLLNNLTHKVFGRISPTNGEDENGVKSGSVPTVAQRISMNTEQVTPMTNTLPTKPSTIENDIFLGKQRVHFIGHDKPLKVLAIAFKNIIMVNLSNISNLPCRSH